MKSILQVLHKIFDAMEFANVGNLGEFHRLLNKNEIQELQGAGKTKVFHTSDKDNHQFVTYLRVVHRS